MLRMVFDTNALLSATLWQGSEAQKLLHACIRKGILLFSSPAIIAEYQRVLERDFKYSKDERIAILEKVLAFLTLIVPQRVPSLVKEDPDDNAILACALESKAECLVTYDKHLLKLKQVQGIQILLPKEAHALLHERK